MRALVGTFNQEKAPFANLRLKLYHPAVILSCRCWGDHHRHPQTERRQRAGGHAACTIPAQPLSGVISPPQLPQTPDLLTGLSGQIPRHSDEELMTHWPGQLQWWCAVAAMAAAIYLISEMKVVLRPGLVPASRSDQVCVASHYPH